MSPSKKRIVRPSEADNWENIIIGGQPKMIRIINQITNLKRG